MWDELTVVCADADDDEGEDDAPKMSYVMNDDEQATGCEGGTFVALETERECQAAARALSRGYTNLVTAARYNANANLPQCFVSLTSEKVFWNSGKTEVQKRDGYKRVCKSATTTTTGTTSDIALVGGGGKVKSTITVKGSCTSSDDQCPESCFRESDCRHPKEALNDNTIDPRNRRTWLSEVDRNYKNGSADTPFDLIYTLETEAVSTQYRLWARPGFEMQAPDSWTLQGSNDAKRWEVLNTQKDVGQWPTVTTGVASKQIGQARSYTFKNSVAYIYYKLSITKCGNNQWTQVSLSQWAIYGQ